MIYKILRKAGLGSTVLNIAKPFIKAKTSLPSVDEANELLTLLSPDPGTSCLWDKHRGMSDIELDIIIPAYNAEKYIARCLDSALSQKTEYSFRLIVIDDGSKDETGSIIDSYAADARMLIVHQENRGFSGARNAGLALSDAKHIMFLDSDDTLCPGAIDALMKPIVQGAAITEGGFNSVDTEGKTLSKHLHKAGCLDLRHDMAGFPWAKIFKAELFDGICLPEGYWYEDSLMAQIIYPTARLRGLEAYGVSAPVYNYTINPAGISHTGRKSAKSIDSYWITRQLYKDRQKLGLESDQAYFEYILSMVVLSYRRAEQQSQQVKEAMFVLWRDFIDSEFSGFETENKNKKILQQALKEGNFALYSAACKLI